MSGGTVEYVAGYVSNNPSASVFQLTDYNVKYFDAYNASCSSTSYQYRILGDATGEMGPFKSYPDCDTGVRYHKVGMVVLRTLWNLLVLGLVEVGIILMECYLGLIILLGTLEVLTLVLVSV